MTYCPICHGETETAESLPDGYSECSRGHRYSNSRALAAHPDDEEKGPDWRPIESAPKDGTDILLYCPLPTAAYQVVGRWSQVVRGHLWLASYEGGDIFEPSHWMPLPPAPEAKP